MLIGERYRLIDRIGHGGMGTVWRAHDELLDRDVAVKEVLLSPELSEAERQERYARTFREARSAARLSHPSVVTVHDVVEDGGRPWIVMELVAAPSLQQVIDSSGPLPVRRVAEIGGQMLAGLRRAHASGILHRDVKPSNVLLTDDRAVLTDFGIAAVEGDKTLTATGAIMGSPAYIAPERIRGERAGPASDLWALGATMYAALDGHSPYERTEQIATLAALAAEEAPPCRNAGPLAPVIDGLLRRDPAQRPTGEQAAPMIARAAAGTEPDGAHPETVVVPAYRPEPMLTLPVATEPVRPRSVRLPMIAAVVGAAVLAGGIGGAVVLLGGHNGHPTAAGGVTTRQPTAPGAAQPIQPQADETTRSATPPSPNKAPDGWVTRHENGYSVNVPATWVRRTDHNSVLYEDPSTRFLLQVDTTSWNGDPLSAARSGSQDLAGRFEGYRDATVTSSDQNGSPAADIRFTYDRATGAEGAQDRFLRIGGRPYTIFFRMPADQWSQAPIYLNNIYGGFRAT